MNLTLIFAALSLVQTGFEGRSAPTDEAPRDANTPFRLQDVWPPREPGSFFTKIFKLTLALARHADFDRCVDLFWYDAAEIPGFKSRYLKLRFANLILVFDGNGAMRGLTFSPMAISSPQTKIQYYKKLQGLWNCRTVCFRPLDPQSPFSISKKEYVLFEDDVMVLGGGVAIPFMYAINRTHSIVSLDIVYPTRIDDKFFRKDPLVYSKYYVLCLSMRWTILVSPDPGHNTGWAFMFLSNKKR